MRTTAGEALDVLAGFRLDEVAGFFSGIAEEQAVKVDAAVDEDGTLVLFVEPVKPRKKNKR